MTKEEQAIVDLAMSIIAREMKTNGDLMTSPALVKNFLLLEIQNLTYEVFGVLFLDTQLQLIENKILFMGTLDAASIYPRRVVEETLKLGAASVLIYHNHPSGVLDASEADKRITKRLQDALELIDVRVTDHIIVGKGETMSFAEKGLL